MVAILIKQILTMFVLAAIGYLMFKGKLLTLEGSKNIGNILIYLSLPCVIINGFLAERTRERTISLAWSVLASVLVLLLSILISRIVFRKDAIASFSAAFSNPGFFGVPLIIASFESGAVFYIAAFIAGINLLQWTYGVSLLTKEGSGFHWKMVAKAPFVYAILIGLFFFFTQIPMPEIAGKCIDFLAGVNTPLAMFTIGIYFAQVDVGRMLVQKSVYLTAAVRLLLIPAAAILLLSLFPKGLDELKLAVLIAAACPVGSNVAVYAQLHHADYKYAVEEVVVSTILSVATIPFVVHMAASLWGLTI